MNNTVLSLIELKITDTNLADKIALWYFNEWGIETERTKRNLMAVCADETQMQVVLTANGTPVATGGVYRHVGLLDRVPRLSVNPYWLALVYTAPHHRKKGYGQKICTYLQDIYRDKGITELYLFTDTAQQLYQKLGWQLSEQITIAGRDLSVMYLRLNKPA